MIRIGKEESNAVAELIEQGKIFRYGPDDECGHFERRYSEFLGVNHSVLCSSGTAALTAGLGGLGIGPGDEVIVPAHTYMATAMAVLSVGAIPVIIDIDESITMDPLALADAIGPRTRAVIPVHMWGHLCDMDAIMAIAGKHDLLVMEDACQCVCGFYHGRAAGSIGNVGAFSFNYFKNMTCGEGGAVVTSDDSIIERVRCMIDPCNFYWKGRQPTFDAFAGNGSRASEFEGTVLNAQLDRVPALIDSLRANKKKILEETAASGLTPIPCHSPEGECATTIIVNFPSAETAETFATASEGTILANTGRHNYTAPIILHSTPTRYRRTRRAEKTTASICVAGLWRSWREPFLSPTGSIVPTRI